MKIAIPVSNGQLALHFGHCEAFALFDVDPDTGAIRSRNDVTAPDHQPGLLPPWLASQGATVIIAGGMGQRAQTLFQQQGIEVIIGAPSDNPERIVQAHLEGALQTGSNICDH